MKRLSGRRLGWLKGVGLAAVFLSSPALAGIQDIAGYEGIRVYEATYVLAHPADFAAGDARLTSKLDGAALSQTGRDFGFFNGNENYDLYFSDANGSLDPLGSYLTIDGNCDVPFQCFNITEVAIRVNGAEQLATGVVRAVYGQPGSFVADTAARAADGDFGTYTQLGDTMDNYPDGRMSLTLSFANVPAIPEPRIFAMMLAGLGLIGFAARRCKAD
jgi:hypothetical protein